MTSRVFPPAVLPVCRSGLCCAWSHVTASPFACIPSARRHAASVAPAVLLAPRPEPRAGAAMQLSGHRCGQRVWRLCNGAGRRLLQLRKSVLHCTRAIRSATRDRMRMVACAGPSLPLASALHTCIPATGRRRNDTVEPIGDGRLRSTFGASDQAMSRSSCMARPGGSTATGELPIPVPRGHSAPATACPSCREGCAALTRFSERATAPPLACRWSVAVRAHVAPVGRVRLPACIEPAHAPEIQ